MTRTYAALRLQSGRLKDYQRVPQLVLLSRGNGRFHVSLSNGLYIITLLCACLLVHVFIPA